MSEQLSQIEVKDGFDLMRIYLLSKVNSEITQLHIQKEIAAMQSKYGFHLLEESIARYFRFTRLEKRLEKYGFKIEDVPNRKHKTWTVRMI